jgi:hypothetical protein
MGRNVAWVLSIVLLLFTGVVGVYNGIAERAEGVTALQKSVTVGVFVYGVFGLITAYGLFRRRSWGVGTGIVWGAAVTCVPAMAIIAYEGNESLVGPAIGASGASALIAIGVVWTAWAMSRSEKVHESIA